MRRRDLLAGFGALAIAPRVTWADAHNPAFLSAARHADGRYHLCGLSASGNVLFHLPLPARGHAAAAHPTRPEAIAFARRPGRYALVIDCAQGAEIARLTPPVNRHFYGHGVFSVDGGVLFTTENDLDTLEGRIGLWDAANGYVRIGDIPSGGIGPHDIARLPGSDTLVVANGGIATHPESGRTHLNRPTMRSNLAYVSHAHGVTDLVELDMSLRQNSIRHLDVREDGLVVAGLQWNGSDAEHPPLVLLHQSGRAPVLLDAPNRSHRQMQNYVGSVCFSSDGHTFAATSPRGDRVQVFEASELGFQRELLINDVCGIARCSDGLLLITSGEGLVGRIANTGLVGEIRTNWSWDNHLVVV